jgi:hypothetical protein
MRPEASLPCRLQGARALVVRLGWTPQAFETWIAEAIGDLVLD